MPEAGQKISSQKKQYEKRYVPVKLGLKKTVFHQSFVTFQVINQ